mgnify:CR=1 FL=1
MNANEILDMIGDAKGTYLWETQKYRDGTAGAKPLPLPRRRLWLVAAVIGLMLLHGGKLEVCLPTYTLACRLECVAAPEPMSEALYWEMSAGRYLSLMTNTSGEPASLDYSLLYSALMSTAAPQVLAVANRIDHLSHPVQKVHES